jgi:HK97 family phage portal protein
MERKNFFTKIFNGFAKKELGDTMDILFQSKQMKSKEESWTQKDFLNAYNLALYVNKAINKRAEKVSEINFILEKNEEIIDDDPLLNLLSKPNKFHTGRQFIALYQKYKDIYGEVYVWLEPKMTFGGTDLKVAGLHLLNPSQMEILYDATYTNVVGYKRQTTEGKAITYKPEEIIFDFYPDPSNPLRGMSILRAGAKAISTEMELENYQVNVLKNGGKIEGIMNFKGDMSPTKLAELKDDYKKNYSEATKAGMPLFLGGEADYKNIALNPTELSYLESKRSTLNDISVLTDVPKVLLSTAEDIKYDNAEVLMRIFLRDTVKPLMGALCEKLNEKTELVPVGYELTFNNPVPDDMDIVLQQNANGIQNYYMTINEARANVGLDPIENGDTILAPFSVSPLGAEPPTPAENTAPAESKKKSFNHPLRDKDFRIKYWGEYIKKADKFEAKFQTELKKYLAGQKRRVVDKLNASQVNSFHKDLMDDVFHAGSEVKIGIKELKPLLETILLKAGNDAKTLVGAKTDFMLTGDIAGWIDKRASYFLGKINDTTLGQLKARLADHIQGNTNRDEFVSQIENLYGDISTGRAKTIARTEVGGYFQKGNYEGYKQAGVDIKIWVAVMDDATRDSHAEADGEEVPMNMPFSNGLMFPHDPRGDAEETINCRCSI